MSGKTSETSKLGCRKCDAGIEHIACELYDKTPTPPEGEAMPEQKETPKYTNRHGEPCSEACGQGRHAECTETFQTCNCTFRGLHKTMHRYATLPAPVVSTAAPEPECPICGKVECMTGLPDTTPAQEPPEGLPVCAKCGSNLTIREIWEGKGGNYYAACPKCDPVAPESYKPAEGPELSELIAQQGIKPIKTGHELEIPGLSDEDMEGFTAATPVTVEAPGKHHPDCVTQIDYITKYSRPDLRGKPCDCGAASPKPIGDVEAVARKIIERVAKDAVMFAIVRNSLEWDEDLEQTDEEIAQDAVNVCTGDEMGCLDESNATADNCTHVFVREALSPFFAPAGPESQGNPRDVLQQIYDFTYGICPEDFYSTIMKIRAEAYKAKNTPAQPAQKRVKNFDWQCENCGLRDDPTVPGKPTICPKCQSNKWKQVPAQPPCSECATLRKERDHWKAEYDTTFAFYEELRKQLKSRTLTEAAEAQLSTLRDALEREKLAAELFSRHRMRNNGRTRNEAAQLPMWQLMSAYERQNWLDTAADVQNIISAALAPTPEVAHVKILRGQRKVSLELEHKSETGTHSIGGVAPKEGHN